MRTTIVMPYVRCLDSIIPLVSISEISSLYIASVDAQAGLSLTWSETPETGFLMTGFTWKGKNNILILVKTHVHDKQLTQFLEFLKMLFKPKAYIFFSRYLSISITENENLKNKSGIPPTVTFDFKG